MGMERTGMERIFLIGGIWVRSMKRKFKQGSRISFDAKKVSEEIRSMGDEITPADYLEYARNNTESESHKCFEWDDAKAAEIYRLERAGEILRSITIEWETVTPAGATVINVVREFENVGDKSNPSRRIYVPIETALSDSDYRKDVFEGIRKDIENLKHKGEMYSWAIKNPEMFSNTLNEALELVVA